ncbi:hypothetical protein HPB50_000496 [Hyalomma asiaticum]|uniref:Uncharacterized protein n=1 Tax=Hyalomma asiaticum TaxID=266040 RepID=A0ACB7RNB6_HYAAI|nr:hypothetical protein HPB50_000496 [Hyalomma asiaticum]
MVYLGTGRATPMVSLCSSPRSSRLSRGRPRCRLQSKLRRERSHHQHQQLPADQQQQLLRQLFETQRRQVLLHSLALLSRAALAPMTRAGTAGANNSAAGANNGEAGANNNGSASPGATAANGIATTASSRRRLGKRLRAKAAQLARETLGRQLLQGLVARSLVKGARTRAAGGLAAGAPLPWLALLVWTNCSRDALAWPPVFR